MIASALLAIVAAMVLVRVGWRGRHGVAWVGWALAAVSLGVLVARDGAWGAAIGGVVGSVVALVMLAYAASTAPARPRRPAKTPKPSIAIPRSARDVARRFAVFLLAVPLAFAATQWVAYGGYGFARRLGAGEADGLALMLFAQPVLWSMLATVVLTRANAARMIAPLAVTASAGTILWGLS